MKLSKRQAALHEQADALLQKDILTDADREFILENWQESAAHLNSLNGAFFTPLSLAYDLCIEIGQPQRIIDLCAGIGTLSLAHYWYNNWTEEYQPEYVCVEINPDYVSVGKKLMPWATWITGDVLDAELIRSLGKFDCCISNPPWGMSRRTLNAPRYTGFEMEYKVIDVASDIAEYGVFIIPQLSASFTYSGRSHFNEQTTGKLQRFVEQTGIQLTANCGFDTSVHKDDWHCVTPICEIVNAEFTEIKRIEQTQLFMESL